MASFDIIDATGNGYRAVWVERGYLMRLALAPVLIKFACLVVIVFFEFQNAFLKQALILLPAYFAEGWLLAHLVRLIFLKERWPVRLSGKPQEDAALMEERSRGIMAAVLMYTLLKMLQTGMLEMMLGASGGEPAPVPEQVGLEAFLLALAMLGFIFWAFRFLWLYIPLAVNYPLFSFVRALGGFSTSAYMFGTWLLAFIPFVMILAMVTSLLLTPYNDPSEIPAFVDFLMTFVQVILDTAIAVVTTATMAYGIQDLFRRLEGGGVEEE